MSDLIDRLREYASTRKGELAELITEAADALERQTCEDAVSRADVIELVKDSYYNLAESIEDTWAMVADVEKLPAVQPEPKPDENGSEPFGNAEMLSDRTTDDCISRQAAIEVIDAVFPVDPMKSEYAQGIACGAALAKTYVKQLSSVQPQPEEDCDTCKHGFFGSRQCDNCRMRFPSYYEREEERRTDE